MSKRTLIHDEPIAHSPEEVFAALHAPQAICQWWNASQAIVVPMNNGHYVVAWGDENDPLYFSHARITTFDPPHRMVFANYQYYAKDGDIPLDADFVVTFEVAQVAGTTRLRVIHDGFPPDSEDFFDSCVQGWANTCAGIVRYLREHAIDANMP